MPRRRRRCGLATATATATTTHGSGAVTRGRRGRHFTSRRIDSEQAEFELVDEAELVEDEQITRTQLVDVLRKSQLVCAGRQRIQQLWDIQGTVSH